MNFYSFRSSVRASSAFITVSLREAYSSAGSLKIGASGCGIAVPWTTRLLPNVCAMGSIAVMWAQGIPRRSTSFVIADPQRVHDPQVETMIAASTPAAVSMPAMLRPNASPVASGAPVPTVE